MRSFIASPAVVCATLAGFAPSGSPPCPITRTKSLRRRWLFLVCMLSACVLAPSAGEAAVLSVTPSSSTVNVGGTVTFDVTVEDVTNLGVFGFRLDFDSTLLSPDPSAMVVGDFLTSAGGFLISPLFDPSSDQDTISMRLLLNSASTAAGAPRTVLSLSFVALAPGVSPITIADALLIDTANRGAYMIGEPYERMAVEANQGSIEVLSPTTAVPEPSTLVLTMTGLGASWWKRRRART
jgi:hypothetical protein